MLERQGADSREIALLTARAASAVNTATEATDFARTLADRADQEVTVIRVNATAALAAAGDRYTALQSEAHVVTQGLGERADHETFVARTWEH